MNAQAEQLKGYVVDLSQLVSGTAQNMDRSTNHSRNIAVATQKTVKPQAKVKNKLSLPEKPKPAAAIKKAADFKKRPEDIIPMDDDFKDF